MLWYKSWLETRWRFAIGLVLLVLSAAGAVLAYPALVKRLAEVVDPGRVDLSGVLGEQIREGLVLSREYHGYVWWQWFHQNLPGNWTIFAAIIGTGGLLRQTSGGAALFTLSMPVSRRRLVGVRTATGLAEVLVLAIVPALALPLFSLAIGQSYSALDALVYGACLFIGGSVFFSLACFLSTVFSDVWRPALIAIAAFYCLSFAEQVSRALSPYGIVRIMTAQSYFRSGQLPWFGLVATAAASAAMLYAAAINIERRDF